MPTPCNLCRTQSTQRETQSYLSPFSFSSRVATRVQHRRIELRKKCFAYDPDHYQASAQSCTRKGFMLTAISALATASDLLTPVDAQALTCQGMRPYELQQCLKAQRAAQEEEVCLKYFQRSIFTLQAFNAPDVCMFSTSVHLAGQGSTTIQPHNHYSVLSWLSLRTISATHSLLFFHSIHLHLSTPLLFRVLVPNHSFSL
jgi:hypothetical protein